MRNRALRAALCAAGSLLCALTISSAASATSIDTTVSGGNAALGSLGGINGYIFYPGSSASGDAAGIGQVALTGKLSSTAGSALTTIPVFCIDVFDKLGKATFTQKDISSITSPNSLGSSPNTVTSFSAAQLNNVLKLLVYTTTGTSPKMNNAVTSAATQLAIWEILNETGSTWDVTAGAFRVTPYGGDNANMATATNDANTWLGAMSSANTSGYGLAVWDPGAGNQRQVQLVSGVVNNNDPTAGAVPEPATWGTIVLGFGLLGGALRNRKRENLQLAD